MHKFKTWCRNAAMVAAFVCLFIYVKKENKLIPPVNQQYRALLTTKQPNHTTKDATTTYDNQPKVKVILILAYMHTGSSFLGNILQNYPGTFYVYEPLRSLQFDTRAGMTVVYMNKTVRNPHGRVVDVSLATDAVSKIITCRHDLLDISTLSRYYCELNSLNIRDMAAYYKCINTRQWKDKPQWPSHSHGLQQQELIMSQIKSNQSYEGSPLLKMIPTVQRCLPLVTRKCENAKIRTYKFIRMTMQVVKNLLPKHPNIKIVHLTRDPRAMIDSQVRKNDMGASMFEKFVQTTVLMCAVMRHDLDLKKNLEKIYPKSIYSFQYEPFLQSPFQEIKKLFEFLGLNFTTGIRDFVSSHTISTDSLTHVWRSHISAQQLKVVDDNCESLYRDLGYIKYRSILDIRNFSNPTFHK